MLRILRANFIDILSYLYQKGKKLYKFMCNSANLFVKIFCTSILSLIRKRPIPICIGLSLVTYPYLLSLNTCSCTAHDSLYFFFASHCCITRCCHSKCAMSCTIVNCDFCIAGCHKTIDKA